MNYKDNLRLIDLDLDLNVPREPAIFNAQPLQGLGDALFSKHGRGRLVHPTRLFRYLPQFQPWTYVRATWRQNTRIPRKILNPGFCFVAASSFSSSLPQVICA